MHVMVNLLTQVMTSLGSTSRLVIPKNHIKWRNIGLSIREKNLLRLKHLRRYGKINSVCVGKVEPEKHQNVSHSHFYINSIVFLQRKNILKFYLLRVNFPVLSSYEQDILSFFLLNIQNNSL